MEPSGSRVKGRRPYDTSRRRATADRRREAIVEAARTRFLREGFAATTISSVAGQVGVSVDTVYKAFGGKAGLLRAIVERSLAGEGPVPAESRSDALQAGEPDPRLVLQGFGALTVEVAPRVAPILLLIRDGAATDPDLAALRAELDGQRLRRMTHNASSLAAAGHLRPGLSVERAGEVMWTYSSPELYELLVVLRGWPVERFGAFVVDALIAALLRPDASCG